MTSYRKAPDEAKRKKKLTRLSGLTEGLIAPALAKKSAYLTQLIAHWPQIAGPFAQWAKPADIHNPASADDDGVLTLSIHSGRGPEAVAQTADILERVNRYFGFQLVSQLRVKQDLPLDQKTPMVSESAKAQPDRSASLAEALNKLEAALDKKSK